MSPTRCNLLILLIHLINGFNVDQYIPTDVNCEVIYSITNQSDEKTLSISWYLDRHVMSGVRHFDLSCDCLISNHHIFIKGIHYCSPLCCHQVSLNTCYDKCQCKVKPILRGLWTSTVNHGQSNFSTCRIGPTVIPKAPPVIVSHARNNDGNSIEIVFKLPAEDLYCDSTDVINSITVNVTDHVNGSYQYINNQPKILHTDEGNYNFTFQVGHHQSRGPLNITISVNNSVGSSPFSNHMIVREINNGDITRNDYELEFYYDPEVSTLQLCWNLSRKAEHMVDSQFITGFEIIVERVSGNNTIYRSLTKKLTLNITLEPNQCYLIIGRILTKDISTWGPEPVYEYFQTPVCSQVNNSPPYVKIQNCHPDITVELHERVTVSCTIRNIGSRDRKVEWKYNDSIVNSSGFTNSDYNQELCGLTSTLIINDFTKANEGLYTCIASQPSSNSSSDSVHVFIETASLTDVVTPPNQLERRFIISFSAGLGGMAIFFVIIVVVCVYALIKSKKNVLSQKVDTQHYTKPPADHLQFKYDLLPIYAEQDRSFVEKSFLVPLGKNGYSIFDHHLNFIPGNAIADNILIAVKESRYIMPIITENFLKSKYCVYELEQSVLRMIKTKSTSVIPVTADIKLLPECLKNLLTSVILEDKYICGYSVHVDRIKKNIGLPMCSK